MAPSSSPHTGSRIPRSLSVECRPKMLKDFLIDDSESCPSSTGFRSFPRTQRKTTLQNEVNAPTRVVRSRSKAASTTISAIYRASEIVFNVVKHLPFNSVKPTSILPRSVSRRLSKKSSSHGEISVPIKVKDILRWKSFRDLEEETPTPLDFSSPPPYHTTTTTTTTTTIGSGTNSKRSSWCDSDFTEDDLQSWCGNYEQYTGENLIEASKKFLSGPGVGEDCMDATRATIDDKGECLFEEKEQNSPVSVLFDSPFRQCEESFSSFHRSLANMESTRHMLMQKIQECERLAQLEPVNFEKCFEEETKDAREKARQFLQNIEGKCSAESCESFDIDHHLLDDFFRQELTAISTIQNEDEFDQHEMLLEVAKTWMKRQYEGFFEWEVESRRVAYLKDMERGATWSKFEEEQKEMTLELGSQMLENLVDELLLEIFDC